MASAPWPRRKRRARSISSATPPSSQGTSIQGNGNLAVSTLANGELWLQNNHGVVVRLNAQQAGILLSNGRYEIFIHMGE